jgi:DNA mismatch repair protein MutS2
LAASQGDLGIAQEVPARPPAPEDLSPGRKVRVRGMKQAVIFRRQDGRNAEVEAGPMRMKIPVADILAIERDSEAAAGAASKGRGITVSARPADEPSIDEINMIGQTVEEATQRLDKILDAAALAGKSQIRVIHGHGTGALRRGIGEFLSRHPLVANFHSEAEDRGGAAITIVELSE